MELYQAMREAKTTRYFTTEPVSEDVLRRILDAARFAPSGGNRQGWRVILVTDVALRRAMRDIYLGPWRDYVKAAQAATSTTSAKPSLLTAASQFAEALHEVPVHAVLCVEVESLALTDQALDRVSIVGGASIYPLAQNVLLACRAEGLGAALTTILVSKEPELKELLGIPDGYAVAAMLAIGHPADKEMGRRMTRRPVEEFTYVNSWGTPV